MMKDNLDTKGIQLLGQERPDILAVICNDVFLPPTQLLYALQALEWYPDKEGLIPFLEPLLEHDCREVSWQTARTLGISDIEDFDPGNRDA